MSRPRRPTTMSSLRLCAAIVVIVAVGACGPPVAGGAGAGDDPGPAAAYEGEWRLTRGRGPSGRIPLPKEATLVIDGKEISGSTACNGYSSRATFDGSSFDAGQILSTAMGCPGPRSRAESRYIDALAAADTIERAGDRLVVRGPGIDLRYDAVPAPEPVPFENTRWHLNGLVYGRGPAATVSDNEPAALTFRSDGTLTGSTGCRKLRGRWERRADAYRTMDLKASGPFRCPAHRHDQDEHVLDVLDDAFTVKVDVRSLDIFQAAGDLGLIYNADR